jgi:spermidine synthase
MTAGTFTLYPSIDRIVVCEIEALIPQAVAQYFTSENYNVVADPRVQIIYDDARAYIRTSHEKFDVITSDPVHPWLKGAGMLYTREYFELARQHLNPGGVISQWVPLYESNTDAVKSEIATFFEVFPNGTVWSNDIQGAGYDLVLLATNEPGNRETAINLDELHQRLNRHDHLAVARSLKEVGFGSVIELFATYAGRSADLAPWLIGAEINRDRNLRLQYLAGMGASVFQSRTILGDILEYRRFPDDLFEGSTVAKQVLRNALTAQQAP